MFHRTRPRSDGVHGLLVWALGILMGAFIAAWTAGGLARTGAEATTASANAAPTGFATALSKASDPVGYLTDTLFRSATPGPATGQPVASHWRSAGRSNANLCPQCPPRGGISRGSSLSRADRCSATLG